MDWTVLPVAIAAWLFQNFTHEAGHVFFAKRKGCQDTKIYPYPHLFKGKFYFARAYWKQPFMKWDKKEMVWLSPIITSTLVILAATFIMFAVPERFHIYLLCFVVAGAVDHLWWIRGFFFGTDSSDGKRWRYGDK